MIKYAAGRQDTWVWGRATSSLSWCSIGLAHKTYVYDITISDKARWWKMSIEKCEMVNDDRNEHHHFQKYSRGNSTLKCLPSLPPSPDLGEVNRWHRLSIVRSARYKLNRTGYRSSSIVYFYVFPQAIATRRSSTIHIIRTSIFVHCNYSSNDLHF